MAATVRSEPRHPAWGPALPKRRDRAVDQPRVTLMQLAEADATRRHAAGRLTLDHDVGTCREREEELAAARPIQVERHAALRGVEREPQDGPLRVGGATPERGASPRRIARRRLDLHHVGAEVAEELAGEEAWLARQVEHPSAVEVAGQ